MGLLGNFLNWLATHLVVIAFAIFLVAGVYLRDSLFPAEPVVAESASNSSVSESSSPQQGASFEEAKPRSLAGQVPSPAVEQVLPEQVAVSNPGLARAESPQALSQPDDASEDQPMFRPMREEGVAMAASPLNSASTRFRDPELQPRIQKADLPRLFEKRLAAARSAFAREDLDSAELHYLRYLSDRPEDAVAFAELGNLYRAMGRTPDALDAYFEAGLRFRDRGEWAEVQQLAIILETAGDERGPYLLGALR